MTATSGPCTGPGGSGTGGPEGVRLNESALRPHEVCDGGKPVAREGRHSRLFRHDRGFRTNRLHVPSRSSDLLW